MRLPQPVKDIHAAYGVARALRAKWGGKARLVSVQVDFVPKKWTEEIEEITFLYMPEVADAESFIITLNNIEQKAGLSGLGSGPRPANAPKEDWGGLTPLPEEAEGIQVDILEAVAIGEKALDPGFPGRKKPEDTVVDLRLAVENGVLAWVLTYDTWDDQGPVGTTGVVLDARTGQVLKPDPS
jgi:hypothetical protein